MFFTPFFFSHHLTVGITGARNARSVHPLVGIFFFGIEIDFLISVGHFSSIPISIWIIAD